MTRSPSRPRSRTKGKGPAEGPSPAELAIRRAVASIPPGCVASYGQVAAMADLPGRARLVGRVLSRLPPGSDVPWQRVLNSKGELSLPGDGARRQRERLEAEGVEFTASGRVNLRRYGLG